MESSTTAVPASDSASTAPRLTDRMRLGALEIRNRIWVSPMCQYSVDAHDGVPTDWHLVHLGSFAVGGAGLVIAEATAVSPEGRITPWDTGLWNDEQRVAWSRIARFIRGQGAAAGIQLAHAGRKASTWRPWSPQRGSVPVGEGGWQTVAPTALAYPGLAEPRALSGDEVAALPGTFAAATQRAIDAGFQVVELHAAHGYLLHEFLSPLSNLREDEWGGDIEGRSRLVLDTARAMVDAAAGRAEVIVRLSATDWAEGGWDEPQTAWLSRRLVDEGVRILDISSGGNVPAEIVPSPGYQVPLADAVRRDANVPTTAVGLITDAAQAQSVLDSGAADAVMIGREHLRDPHFANRAAAEFGHPGWVPPQYLRAPFGGASPGR